MRPISLETRVLLSLSLPFALVAVLMVLLVPPRLDSMMNEAARKRALGISTVLSSALSGALAAGDLDEAQRLLAVLASVPGAERASARAPDGGVVLGWAWETADGGVHGHAAESRPAELLEVTVPLSASGSAGGAEGPSVLVVAFSQHDVHAMHAAHFSAVALGAALLVLFGLVFGALTSRALVQRRRASAALLDSERSFRTLIEGSPDSIFVVQGGRIAYANAAAAAMLGTGTAAELVGRRLAPRLHPDDQEVLARIEAGAGAGPPAPPCEVRLRRSDGGHSVAEMVAVDLVFAGAPSVVVIARDTTERTSMQARCVTAERLASVGMLAAGVAHEINNPLTYILGNIRLATESVERLQAACASGGRDAWAEDIRALREGLADAGDGAERVRAIVHDLRTFSRSDEGAHGAVDVTRVLESSVRMANNGIRHCARLVKSYGACPLVDASEARLGQVFLNLLVNATQAIPPGRADRNEIRLTVGTDEDGNATVEVRDTGPGIAPEILDRVFDPFYTTKPVGVGVGLGLFICHNIVSGLGGRIEAESEPGHGTCFRVRLPPSAAEHEMRAPGMQPAAGTAPRGRVLVIDDDPLVSAMIRRALHGEHEVDVVGDGAAGLERLRALGYDAILCDLMMPEMTGADVFAAIASEHPALRERFVLVTGGSLSAELRGRLDGVPILEKPVTPELLRETVRKRM